MDGVTEMNSLPKEIWLHIFNFLDGKSLSAVETVCVAFSDWLTDDLFWFNKCQRALASVHSSPSHSIDRTESKASWKDLYINLISPYKYLLGCWQQLMVGDEPDGQANKGTLLYFFILPKLGLMYGRMSEYKPLEYTHSLVSALTIHSDGELSSHRPVERYPFGILSRGQNSLESCFVKHPLDEHSSYLNHIFLSDVMEFGGLNDSDTPTRWLKLRSLTDFRSSLLQAGVFTSRYGGHGTEFIHVCHLSSQKVIVGTKLLGDDNVPYGKHTFVVDLTKPLFLSLSEQETFEQLRNAAPSTSDNATTGPQPFRLPYGAANQDLLPTSCLARYVGRLTYAQHNFVEPAWCPAHFIQFTPDFFIILALRYVPMLKYTREPSLVF